MRFSFQPTDLVMDVSIDRDVHYLVLGNLFFSQNIYSFLFNWFPSNSNNWNTTHTSGNLYSTTQLTLFRYTITALRNLGLSAILPLDNNIFIHKVIGTLVFVQAWCHTIMHLINFGVNVQPDPLKFVQINSEYWNWKELGYNMPTGCWMENENSSSSFQVQVLGQ